MSNLIISDDNENEISYVLTDYKIFVNHNGLLWYLKTDKEEIKYTINTDEREKDINQIKTFLEKQCNLAMQNIKKLYISEFQQRCYIFVGKIEDEMKQFTAFK